MTVAIASRQHILTHLMHLPDWLPWHAGKSTFLDLLAGRKTVGEQKGHILFSGVRPTSGFLKRYTGACSPPSSRIITFFADSLP